MPQISSTDWVPGAFSDLSVGPLEGEVLEILWQHGPCSVRDVQERMGRRLAYTTIMTTLDRLYKKGRLERTKFRRSFRYAPASTRANGSLERMARALVRLLTLSSSEDLLISCLVDAVGVKDVALLEELERRISARRMELNRAENK